MNMTEHRIPMDRVVEVLFNDTSKNISDLKSRQWTSTNLGVLAIMALSALTHGPGGTKGSISRVMATVFMALIVVGHAIVFYKFNRNFCVFKKRLIDLAERHFSKESEALFKDGGGARSVVVDEGRITTTLFIFPTLAFLCGQFVVWLS